MPCAKCTELERRLKEAWETILRLDGEIKAISVWPLLLDNSSARSLIPDARFLPPAPSHGTA